MRMMRIKRDLRILWSRPYSWLGLEALSSKHEKTGYKIERTVALVEEMEPAMRKSVSEHPINLLKAMKSRAGKAGFRDRCADRMTWRRQCERWPSTLTTLTVGLVKWVHCTVSFIHQGSMIGTQTQKGLDPALSLNALNRPSRFTSVRRMTPKVHASVHF